MSRNNLPTFSNSHPQELLEESLSPYSYYSYVQEQEFLEESSEKGPIYIARTTGTSNSTLHTDTKSHTSWREESWEDRTMKKGEHDSSSMINSTFCGNNSNHRRSVNDPSFTPQTHFPQQKKRKKKSKQHLATTLSFPYKHLLDRDMDEATGPRFSWQQYNDDDEDGDRVQFLEKYFIPEWQLKFMKQFYVQGSSCKQSSDKYLGYISTNEEHEDQDARRDEQGKQEVQSLLMIDGENVHASNTDMYPSYNLWDGNDHIQHCSARTAPRVELIVAFDVFIEESKNLLTYMDFSDFSRQKVKVFEKEKGIDREKILRKVV